MSYDCLHQVLLDVCLTGDQEGWCKSNSKSSIRSFLFFPSQLAPPQTRTPSLLTRPTPRVSCLVPASSFAPAQESIFHSELSRIILKHKCDQSLLYNGFQLQRKQNPDSLSWPNCSPCANLGQTFRLSPLYQLPQAIPSSTSTITTNGIPLTLSWLDFYYFKILGLSVTDSETKVSPICQSDCAMLIHVFFIVCSLDLGGLPNSYLLFVSHQ